MAKTPRARKTRITKIQRIVDYWTANPDATTADLIERFDAHSSQISVARHRLPAKDGEAPATNGHSTDPIADGSAARDIATLKRIGIERVRGLLALYDKITGG